MTNQVPLDVLSQFEMQEILLKILDSVVAESPVGRQMKEEEANQVIHLDSNATKRVTPEGYCSQPKFGWDSPEKSRI